jgi:hypothetical protein
VLQTQAAPTAINSVTHEGDRINDHEEGYRETGAERTPDFESLAELIAAVVSHPNTPHEIYDSLIDGINECIRRRDA